MTKPVLEVVRIGKRGEITLPRRIRAAMKLQEGDELILSIVEQRLVAERRTRNFAAYLDVIGGTKLDD
jgi:AbrB family looped-hinge helix DNA binding protein